jgi:apolipoprotein N-acyltransferase
VKPLLLAFLAGLISACGFQPVGLWPLVPLAFSALLWLLARAPRLRDTLAIGWWFGVGQFVLGLNWIATAFTYQAAMPAWLGWIAVVLLSLYLAVYPAIAAGIAWRYGRRDTLALILWLAAIWVVTEWLRASLFTGFAWNPAGVALLPTFVAPLSRLIGTYGLSGIAVLIGGAVLLLVKLRWRTGLALLAAIVIVSVPLYPIPFTRPSEPNIPVRVVQPNIGQEERWEGDPLGKLQKIVTLSRSTGNEPRLLLWPESAVTEPLEDGRADGAADAAALQRWIGQRIGSRDLLLAGGITVSSKNRMEATGATNSIFAIAPGGRILARYDKAHLVPYGEYLPMRPVLSAIGLSRLAPGDLDFAPGPGPRTFNLPLVGKVGFQLCYEIIFSGQVVDRRNRPAFIFNPSNDAWFGGWGPPQHLAQARLRALEEGMPIVRATPTGISAVIDADGRVVASLAVHEQGVIDTILPVPHRPTLFARFGNLLPMFFALLLAAVAIAVGRKAR